MSTPPNLAEPWSAYTAAFRRMQEAVLEAWTPIVAQLNETVRRVAQLLAGVKLREGEVSGRFYCRTHGEMLIYRSQPHAWRCPEFTVCGTWVPDEHVEATAGPDVDLLDDPW